MKSLILKIKQALTFKKILKEAISLLIIFIVFLAIQGWMNRNMVEGIAPSFEAKLLNM